MCAEPARIHGFAPVARPDARILILGTMPGMISLQRNQYYANARNAFWPIAQALFKVDLHAGYDDRLTALQDAGVALWDVLSQCVRPGSLDAAIVAESAAPNDFVGFLARHPCIEVIGLNGAKAAQLFRRHVVPTLAGGARQPRLVTLPSTSPAHAAQRFDSKLLAWRGLLEQV
ncbi:DNA-deoxyinosine glycosylase [Bordetella holmesii]|uniref:DNA-deoxyinosine glycosylase n=2 Tax=Bordetella holmesii TaxID=35814 RepID=A0A158M293_9BORD|nr:DNA-deoxyinosine glycosylase [Bordetella holmesii]AMD47052.1 DNA-deoxyinosine glycosylase [Bordetella holmesii H558]AMD47569.1 DNA glycosylase [Bordetella holmesii F627]AOB35952.1 DNA-deoxyinosine glycosylase [Bordetella holmesii]AUL19923.1 DNA-deoxyinosine glycosylase [Bordetella holmesii]AUL23265.1 DNA-deoxyinosine glycosylase [Bordetella holmesii]